MTEIANTIFEKYQVRKTREQKTKFIDHVLSTSESLGYSARVENGRAHSRNIVVGDPKKARVVFTAHYDTCPRLPFPNFITPKNIAIYLTYQILVGVLIYLIPIGCAQFVTQLLLQIFAPTFEYTYLVTLLVDYAVLILVLYLLLAGPANKHTANDNTSGVVTLLELMHALPEDDREKAAFVFFDLEESGLIGSKSFAVQHKAMMSKKLLINFDCVSDGEIMLFALRPDAACHLEALQAAFQTTEAVTAEHCTRGVFYPSDQKNFPCGVGVAALKKTKKGKLLYMNRIHTKRDTIWREENIAYLTNGSIALIQSLK